MACSSAESPEVAVGRRSGPPVSRASGEGSDASRATKVSAIAFLILVVGAWGRATVDDERHDRPYIRRCPDRSERRLRRLCVLRRREVVYRDLLRLPAADR